MVYRRWEICTGNELLAKRIATELNLTEITGRMLVNRGIACVEEARGFFQLELKHLLDPFLLPDIEVGIERLILGLKSTEKMVIFGDYDVDGITGTSLLWRVLRAIGANVDYYIPDRTEGYGMNVEAVKRLAQGGYTLIITVDNGISCVAEVELAATLGVDVIITDHHEPPEVLPAAYAVINPKLSTSRYPCPHLSGVGVAFKFCQALAERLALQELTRYIFEQLDIVTLGTIADIVPLIGENRVIAANGLKKLNQTQNIGLQALIKVAALEDKELNAGHVGFALGPRINAIGRLDNPCLGVELLTTANPKIAEDLAGKLDLTNRKRQMVEETIVKSAIELIEKNGIENRHGIILASADWHPGVIGIAASKLMERYYRPTILININNGVGKGSARSIRGLNLYEALTHCREHLLNYGGHEMAAGLSVAADNIGIFAEAFDGYAASVLKPEDLIPYLKIDAGVNIAELDFALLNEIERLGPNGPGNPRPILAITGVNHEHNIVGANGTHLKLKAVAGERKLDGIAFGMAEKSKELKANPEIDVAFELTRNVWQNRESLQMMVVDFKPTELPLSEKLFRDYEQILTQIGKGQLSWPVRENLPKAVLNLTIFDQRQKHNRDEYLKTLLTNGEKTIIYTSSPEECMSLAKKLKSSAGGKLVYYHEYLTESDKKGVIELFTRGDIKVVVATLAFIPNGILDIRHVVYYHLCYDIPGFILQSSLAGQDGKKAGLHLLYRDEDKVINERILESYSPDRDFLAKVYILLSKLAGEGGSVALSNAAIAAALKDGEIEPLKVQAAIEIFAELKLISITPDTATRKITLMPRPKQKLDLSASIRYNEGIKLKQAFGVFCQAAFDAEPDKLLHFIQNSQSWHQYAREVEGSELP